MSRLQRGLSGLSQNGSNSRLGISTQLGAQEKGNKSFEELGAEAGPGIAAAHSTAANYGNAQLRA